MFLSSSSLAVTWTLRVLLLYLLFHSDPRYSEKPYIHSLNHSLLTFTHLLTLNLIFLPISTQYGGVKNGHEPLSASTKTTNNFNPKLLKLDSFTYYMLVHAYIPAFLPSRKLTDK